MDDNRYRSIIGSLRYPEPGCEARLVDHAYMHVRVSFSVGGGGGGQNTQLHPQKGKKRRKEERGGGGRGAFVYRY